MNPNTPPPPDDDALAREERELAALYRRLPQAEPDAALDAAVLAHASRAAESRRRHALPRWAVALSSAAVLVLAAGLVWRLEFAQQQAVPVEAPAAVQQAQQATQDAATTQDMAPPPAEPVAAPAPARAPPPAMARRAPAAAPHQPAPQMREEKERQAPAIVQQAQGLTAPQAKVLAAPPAKRAANMPPRIAPPPPVDEASAMALPPPPAPPPPAPPAPSKPSMVVLQEHPAAITTVFAADMAKPDGTAATASTASRGETAAAPPAFTKKVEQIREALRQGGSRDEARKAVRALQRDFPDVALPDDLRAFGDEQRP